MPQERPAPFNTLIVGQSGRLQFEALLFAASMAANAPACLSRLFVAEPQPGPLWPEDPRMSQDIKSALKGFGARILPFDSRYFGKAYPYGNKIEALSTLPEGEPFVFFDSDTLVTGDLAAVPFDFDRPAASMRREGTWPVEDLYWPGYAAVWSSLYTRFGLDFAGSLDLSQPDEYWERYLYFNAGWFFGADPADFGRRFTKYATSIRDDPPEALVIQPLDPWLDQIALPLVVHSLGGGRPGPDLAGLDGDVTCHWRALPLLYARESDRVVQVLEEVAAPNKLKKLLKRYDPMKRMIYQGRGQKVRAMFDREALPRREQKLRNQIKAAGFWMR